MDYSKLTYGQILSIADQLNKSSAEMEQILNEIKDMEGLFNFEVIDKRQIEQIVKDNKEFLPKSTVNIPKDQKWNENRIHCCFRI